MTKEISLDTPVLEEGRHPFFIIAPLWLTAFIVSCQLFIVSPLLPIIQDELLNRTPPTDFALGFLGTAYSVVLAFSTLIVGPISDRVGRRRVLVVGTALIAAVLLLHGVAVHYESLLVMRALTGMATGVYSGSMVAFVGDYFPYKRRGWATGWILTGVACGQILGMPAGILLANAYGFQTPFIVFGGLMVLASAMAWWYLPQPNVKYDEVPFSIPAVLRTYGTLLQSRGPCCRGSNLFPSLCKSWCVPVLFPQMAGGGCGNFDTATGPAVCDRGNRNCCRDDLGWSSFGPLRTETNLDLCMRGSDPCAPICDLLGARIYKCGRVHCSDIDFGGHAYRADHGTVDGTHSTHATGFHDGTGHCIRAAWIGGGNGCGRVVL